MPAARVSSAIKLAFRRGSVPRWKVTFVSRSKVHRLVESVHLVAAQQPAGLVAAACRNAVAVPVSDAALATP